MERAVEASLQLETRLVEFTSMHPEVVVAQDRATRLVDALAPAPDASNGMLRQRVLARQSLAEHSLAELRVVYADKHPAIRVARARARFLSEAGAAFPDADAPDLAAARVVSKVETDIRLGLAAQRYEDGHPQVVALRAQSDALTAPAAEAPACVDILRTFDLRVAFLTGQETGADDTADLEAIIDALVIARVGYRAASACGQRSTPPQPPPQPPPQ